MCIYKCIWGFTKLGVPYWGVLMIRESYYLVSIFRVPLLSQTPICVYGPCKCYSSLLSCFTAKYESKRCLFMVSFMGIQAGSPDPA